MIEIIEYVATYREDAIHLILDVQNREAGLHLSLEEQPDLYDIEKSYLQNGGNFWLARNEKDEVIGTIGLMRPTHGYGILKKFFVRCDYRGQKVGLQLYQRLMDACQKKEIKALLLDTPSVAKASHSFYEQNGFIKITKEDLPIPYEFPDRDSFLYLLQVK